MKSYKFARRSFLAAAGGAFGLKVLLRNMEVAAQGAGAPPRFLMVHWPCGNVMYPFVPVGTGSDYSVSTTHGEPGYIIAPFATAELRPHTHIFGRFHAHGFSAPGGGPHESGTPWATTGVNSPGTRSNGGETDDSCAGGPSWDQILLEHVPELRASGRGYYNSICDSRVDSYETSARCLSYSCQQQSIQSSHPGGQILEHIPLLPTLSPITAYNDLFGGFTPGTIEDEDALRLLKQRKSVLDHSRRELGRLSELAPANERVKIEAHGEVIRKLETQLSEQLEGTPSVVRCEHPLAPPESAVGQEGSVGGEYGLPEAATDDAPLHAEVGAAHSSILRAAMACDLIRVGSFQWAPGTSHVSFQGSDPNSPERIYMHHPVSHRKLDSTLYHNPAPDIQERYVWDVLTSIQHWYFEHTALFIQDFLDTVDPLSSDGGSLLERTVITMFSEVGDASHDRSNTTGLIIGGSALGMKPGAYHAVDLALSQNSFWLTAMQPFLGADPLAVLEADERLNAAEIGQKADRQVVEGVWAPPP